MANTQDKESTFFENEKGKITYSTNINSLKLVKLSDLRQHSLNKNIYAVDIEKIKRLSQNIRDISLINRIIINTNNEILSGNLRFEALKFIPVDETEVYVINIKKEDELEFIISSNQQREKSIIDARNEINCLFEKYSPGQGIKSEESKNTIKKISEVTGYKTNKISSIRRIDKMFPELLSEIDLGNLTLHGAMKKCDIVLALQTIGDEMDKDYTSELTISNIDKKLDIAVISYCKEKNPEYYEMLNNKEITSFKAFNDLFCPKTENVNEGQETSGSISISTIQCPCCSQIVKKKNDVEWLKSNSTTLFDFITKMRA